MHFLHSWSLKCVCALASSIDVSVTKQNASNFEIPVMVLSFLIFIFTFLVFSLYSYSFSYISYLALFFKDGVIYVSLFTIPCVRKESG